MKAVKKVGLRADLAKRVQNGTIDVTKYDGDTQKKIKEYQDLYEKLLKAKDAVDELRVARANLYKDRFENVAKAWESQIDTLDFDKEQRESRIKQRSEAKDEKSGTNARLRTSRANIDDYRVQIGNLRQQRSLRLGEVDALKAQLRTAVYSGNIKSGSEEYNSMVEKIRSAQSEVDNLSEEIIDNTNEIAKEYRNMFDVIQTQYDNTISNLEYRYDNIESRIGRRTDRASEYRSAGVSINASKSNIADYNRLINNDNAQLERRKQERSDLQKALRDAMKNGGVKKGSEEYYDMLSEIRSVQSDINDLNEDIIANTNNIAKEYVNAFDAIESKYEYSLNKLETDADKAEQRISRRNAQANSYNYFSLGNRASRRNILDYNRLNANARSQIRVNTKERDELQAQLNSAVKSGSIVKGSEAYNKMLSTIQSKQNDIDKLNDSILSNTQSIAGEYRNMFNNVQTYWDNAVQGLQYSYDRVANAIDRRTDRASEYVSTNAQINASKKNIADYNKLITNTKKQIASRNKELAELRKRFALALSSGTIKKGSEEYYSMLDQIHSAQLNIDNLSGKLIDNANKLAKEYVNAFSAIETRFENSLNRLENSNQKIENRIGRRNARANEFNSFATATVASRGNISDYKRLNKNAQSQITIRQKEIQELRKQLNAGVKRGAIKKYSEAYYDMLSTIQSKQNEVDSLNSSIIENVRNIAQEYQNMFNTVATKFDNSLNKLENTAQRIENRINRRNARANEFNSMATATAASRGNIADYRRLNRNSQSQIAVRQKEIAALRKQLNAGVKSGAIKKYSEAYYNMLSTIQSKQNEVDNLNSNIIENSRNIAEEYRNMFEQIGKRTNNLITVFDHFTTEYNTALDKATAKGYATSTKYYTGLMKFEQKKADKSRALANSLQKKLDEGIKTGSIKMYSQAWYDMTNEILKAREATNEATAELAKYAKEVQQVKWDRFDYLQDRLSEIRDESEFLIELMKDEDAFDDSGAITKYGMATVGLHTMNYDSYLNQVKRYSSELKSINAQLAKDPNDTILLDRRKELLETQREMILASQKEKQAIRDLVEDGINKEINSLGDLIDKYLDALDSQKDLYDYQKQVADKAEEIASLQKQLDAYSGDNSTEALARIQKITKDLKEAQEDLEETEYDRYISDSRKMLTDLKEEFEQRMNERLDNIDSLISEVSADVNANSKEIGKTLKEQASEVGYTISSSITSVWNGSKSILTATNASLTNIENSVKRLWAAADSIASTLIKNIGTDYDKTRYKKYASGSKNITKDQLGWTNESGQELLYRSGSGAILTPLGNGDKVFSADMANNLWNLSKGIVNGTDSYITPSTYRSMLNSIGFGNGVNQNFENITFNLPNVTDYDSLVRQMQSDNKFEKLIQAMTVGRLNGKSKSSKNHIIF